MKRLRERLTIPILLLVLLACALIFSGGFKTHAARAAKVKTSVLNMRGPSLTIVFRGLMAFRRDHEEQTFTVGILPAPRHEFTMQVLEKSAQGVFTYSIPVNQLMPSKSDTLLVEVPAKRNGVSYYQNGIFDRKRGLGDTRDFRWLIDLEAQEFYGHRLTTDQQQMGVSLRFSNGEFYTKTTTLPLERKLGGKTFEFFGRVAQEIATDVFLEEGDFVLTSQATGAELFRLKQKPDTTYEVVFENAPPPMQHAAMQANHFQYFYRLFPMPRSQWYEFRVLPSALVQTGLSGRNLNLVEFAHPPVTDEAPCMGSGYGGGGSLPKFPPG